MGLRVVLALKNIEAGHTLGAAGWVAVAEFTETVYVSAKVAHAETLVRAALVVFWLTAGQATLIGVSGNQTCEVVAYRANAAGVLLAEALEASIHGSAAAAAYI